MGPPLVYVDTAELRDGADPALRTAIRELAAFVEQNVPEMLAYGVYLNERARSMSVVHVHVDSSSLEHHLQAGGPVFRRFADLLTLTSIHLYGEPSPRAVELLHEKARMLACEEVVVHAPEAGFGRFGSERA
jgi:hypothetical protein